MTMVTKEIIKFFFLLELLVAHSQQTTIKIGVLLMTEATEPFDLRRTGPALEIGFEDAKSNYGITFEVLYHNYTGFCPKETVIGHLSELYYEDNVKAVIGPACSGTIIAAGRLAQYLKLPMVTGLGDLVVRDPMDNDMYESLTILSYNLRKLSNSISAIMQEYKWKNTAIIYDLTYVFFDLAASNLVYDFRLSSTVARPYDVPFIPDKVSDYGDLLVEASAHARVFIIFCNSDMLRDFLYRAYHLGMANGDYVFITMELFPSDWLGYYTEFLRGDEKDHEVTKAYESLLLLTLRQPDNPEYELFAEQVKLRAKRDYGYEFGAGEKVNYFITAFYDSAMYLALSYKTVLDEGGDINDGMLVAQRLWNSTFDGITGPVKVDGVGNRVADFDVFDMKSPDTREFQLVGRFRGATQQYVTENNVDIVWPNGLPVNKPRCGYSNELCIEPPDNNTTTIIVICVSIVTLATVALIIISLSYRYSYTKIKSEQELGRKTWLVEYSDIQIRKGRLNDSFLSKSLLTLDTKEELAQVFTRTGYCKNQTVAIRKLHLQNVEITRQIAVEFRQMQLASHGNIAKFIGACLDNQHSIILMEYCPRGSLQDMLQNDSIELDWAFRYSLINDIIKGMIYLHYNSPIHVHGRLSSTNCVIDSRFALKLTDYGPKSLLLKDRAEERRVSQLARTFNSGKLLWTAPEHLCLTPGGVIGSSQKGDVYSFAIILQEIAMRAGPFEGNSQDVDEILKILADNNGDIVRPVVPPDACSSALTYMMKNCWQSNPLDRPSFNELDESFRKMRVGQTTNIMDNLLQRMSNYADNLEALAAERTKAYLDEKQKVEELLHRLLPPSVARQLQSGQPVSPETFDCVTIYFSDIVGFTTICSKSSPIEVVDLLNDLYTAFDNEIDRFRVYKVETIGDAYMCVSGLPERIGTYHVTEICNMSLVILNTVKHFTIRHMPMQKLEVRIGVHSGPVVAGVVGLTMPRYCLFGDTVNTASRMESTSEASRIQLSSVSKRLLEEFPTYNIKERGEIEIKGKGQMTTYWLEGCDRKESVIAPGGVMY
ncbi:atrial natriuretic peptide receptor 1-like [Ruditapes philippinarum]|uniref:atrial natriuretic peptide receptor 1-like n=1 Tax=Ruditapes philippinarum TaxID=129788 RepID=UPI00295B796D|nr:atrial natriuretic peptide receptor 1-like [Ruditapes philippinarum]